MKILFFAQGGLSSGVLLHELRRGTRSGEDLCRRRNRPKRLWYFCWIWLLEVMISLMNWRDTCLIYLKPYFKNSTHERTDSIYIIDFPQLALCWWLSKRRPVAKLTRESLPDHHWGRVAGSGARPSGANRKTSFFWAKDNGAHGPNVNR